MKRLLSGLALALLIPASAMAAPPSAEAITYYVSLDQATPRNGDLLTFTLTFPQDAAKNSRHPQFHDQPYVQVDCYQAGVHVYRDNAGTFDQRKIGRDEWLGTAGYILFGNLANENTWTSGEVDCTVNSFYFTIENDVPIVHYLASSTFHGYEALPPA